LRALASVKTWFNLLFSRDTSREYQGTPNKKVHFEKWNACSSGTRKREFCVSNTLQAAKLISCSYITLQLVLE
jgi:hypothetical protein